MSHRRALMVITATALLAGLGLIPTGAAAAFHGPYRIRGISGHSDVPAVAASAPDLAWSANGPDSNSGPYNVYYRGGFRVPRRVNPPHTQALMGGIDAGWSTINCCRPRLIFQQIHDGQSDLRLFNLETHVYSNVPSRWNSGIWQRSPTLSFNYVLFGRTDSEAHRSVILLGDLRTRRLKVLASLTGASADERPGQVNGNWATWTACTNVKVACDVYEYNIATGHTTKVSNTFADGTFQYAPSVAKDGTVYFVHSGLACGAAVTLNRRVPGQPRSVFLSLPDGLDIHYTSVFDVPKRGGGQIDYTRYNCAAHQAYAFFMTDDH